ncbi:hypothetical protein LBMAG56_06750 [Verrucomicrobiota bacterium]|nr:hypothetical protein LBMAG56_06750 [Verrucomicrobiota bacterium]
MHRLIRVIAAWSLGWLVYMIAMVMTVYDGITSLIFQPIIAVVFSTVAVGVSLLAGCIFRIPPMSRFWRSSWFWAAALAGGSILTMIYGADWGLTQTFTNPETGHQSVGLRLDMALVSYLVLIFAITNWPVRRSDDT